MRFRIKDLPSPDFLLGAVLTLEEQGGDHRVTVYRDWHGSVVELTISVAPVAGAAWRVRFALKPRRLQGTMAELCTELHACAEAAARICLPGMVQYCLSEGAFALAAYVAELAVDNDATAALLEASWSPEK